MNKLYKIVLCGSMSHHEEMVKLKKTIDLCDYEVVIPDADEKLIMHFNIKERKRQLSIDHFKQVCDHTTRAILVVNLPKNGILNYIGANTFAEIALAFFNNKRIFILEDIYEMYEDELNSWNVIPLHGNIKLMRSYLNILI